MRIKNNSKGILSAVADDGYFKNQNWNDNNLTIGENRIRKIKYFLTKPELNTYLSGFREELISKITPNINNINDVYNLIKTTSSYNKIFKCGVFVEEILNEKNIKIQEDSLKTWNLISNKKIYKYSQLKKIIKISYNRRYRNFLTKVSRIAYEVYNEFCNKTLLPSSYE